MNLQEAFNEQIDMYDSVSEEMYENIEYLQVWSGREIQVGDKVLYAFVDLTPDRDDEEKDIRLIEILERELGEMEKKFEFMDFRNQIIPVLKKKK